MLVQSCVLGWSRMSCLFVAGGSLLFVLTLVLLVGCEALLYRDAGQISISWSRGMLTNARAEQ